MIGRIKMKIIRILVLFFFFLTVFSRQTTTPAIETKKIDVILLQDESLSMNTNDRNGVRPYAASCIGEMASLAGQGNKISLVIYGAVADESIPLFDAVDKNQFRLLRDKARAGFSDD